MTNTSILRRPIITEKSTQKTAESSFTFEVDSRASKGQVKQVVEDTFNVTVLKVNTTMMPGRSRRVGKQRRVSQSPRWKKAIIQLKSGDKIGLFELQESK